MRRGGCQASHHLCVNRPELQGFLCEKKLGGVGGSLEAVVRVLNLHCLEVVGGSVLLCVRPLLMLSLEL